jgi:hypothetical protein
MSRTSAPLSVFIAIIIGIGSGALAGAPLAAQKSGGVALPKIARKALDAKWKGWQLATMDPQSQSCRGDGGESPVVLQGDFDDDGRLDTALAIKTAQGVRLVAAMARVQETLLYDIDSLGDAAASGYLGLERRGTKFTNPNTKLDDYFAADTLTVYRCGQPRTAHIWTGLGFSKVTIP